MKDFRKQKAKSSSKLMSYASKRTLSKSKEPKAKDFKRTKGDLEFVIQKHAASRLHYDLRLEVDGVLKSWAIPKGPSLDPKNKRLAIMVEDHPFGYKDFEGVIEEGYGKGAVIIWDRGSYSVKGLSSQESEDLMRQGLNKGEVHFSLEGEKLKGEFILVKLKKEKDEWLLIKAKDPYASKIEITKKDRSVVSNHTLEELGGPRSFKPALQKAPKAKSKPHAIKPMLCTLIDKPFDDEGWIFELKLDGFRAVAELKGSRVELYSRNFKSFNERFPSIVTDLQRLKLDAIFDGEVVALDQKGISRFQLLQNQLSESNLPLFYYVFDILYLNGKDLRKLPLIERKALLKSVLKKESTIRYLDHLEKKGISFLKRAEKVGCEGIVGKKKESPYRAGERTKEWVKIKAHQRQEAIICGFTEPRRGRKNFGALILGAYKNGELSYIGHVGGGFTDASLARIKNLLLPDVQKKCPFKKKPPTNTAATWVKPKHLCEVRFSEWTKDGSMRQPIFLGLNDQKPAKEVVPERPKKTKEIVENKQNEPFDFISHVDKVYWPKEKITKGDVLHYYAEISKLLLPHLIDRPQSLKRYPDGIEGGRFFQKNVPNPPPWATTIPIEHKEKTVNYLLIQDLKSLLYAINLGCIELHPWFSRYQTLDYPEFLVFDLDPEAISFDSVIETAKVLYEVLNSLDVPSYCKTTGATGLHVCVPLHAKYTYEQAKQFALLIATYVQQQIPEITSLERLPKNRQKKVYIDCFQNNGGQTIVSPYSLRALPGAPVATPLEWKEMKKGILPTDYNLHTIFKRIQKKGDLFKPLLQKGIDMKKALKKFEKLP